jgi:protein O-GlcNAc transferase
MAEASHLKTLSLAIECYEQGRWGEAREFGQQILEQEPNSVETLHLLSVIALREGNYENALAFTSRALALAPHPAIHSNHGEACRHLGRLNEAAAHCRQALALDPNYADALNNLGVILTGLEQADEAIIHLQKAISLRPDHAESHYNLGIALTSRHRFEDAAKSFQRALDLKPDFPEALNNLGNVFGHQGKMDQARACFERAIELKPQYADPYNNLGNYFKDAGQGFEAVSAFRRACDLKPESAAFHSNLILALHYQSSDEDGVLKPELARWNRRHAQPLTASIRAHGNGRSPDRRLRIGYVSADFCWHPVGLNILPLLENHAHGQYEIFCYASVPVPDSFTARVRACADHWRDIAPLTDVQVADLVREDQIDILVDLALHTANNRLLVFARKPAPIQVSFAGYPGGTGLEAIDCHLTDPHLEPVRAGKALPPGDLPFRLPHTFWCYTAQAADVAVGPLPALRNGHVTFGCLNNFCKINDGVLRVWAQVLSAVPGSRLTLLTSEGSHRQRALKVLSAASVSPDRINFVDRQQREKYLALYRDIDLGLDTVPYNGHTTSLDSYWMGVPVVSFLGSSIVGRAGWSQLSNLGLPELVARTEDQFIQIAATLAGDLPNLAALRAGLRDRMRESPLMDAPRFAQGIEAAYRTLWREWCAQPGAAAPDRAP